MSAPIYKHTNFDPGIVYYYKSTGVPILSQVLYSQLAEVSSSVDNPIDSRPYPANPLTSQTGMDMQSRSRMISGHKERDVLFSGDIWKWERATTVAASVHTECFPADLDWQTKMRLDIKSLAVNLGTALAEYRQTVGMFNSLAYGIHGAWKSYRGLRKRRRLTTCDVAASELIMSYGIMPLMSDLTASIEVLQRRLQLPIHRRFISTVSDNGTSSYTPNTTRDVTWKMSQRAIAHVKLVPNYSEFTLGNPAEIAWEVVPFSFVIDWAIPIGDYLSALDALSDVVGVAGTVSTKRWYTHTETLSSLDKSLGWYQKLAPRTQYESHSRQAIASIPLPRMPTYNPSRSLKAVMHGLSLLRILRRDCRR